MLRDLNPIPIVIQMESRYSMTPMVVAENIFCADTLKKDTKSETFGGSPLLLHVISHTCLIHLFLCT